MLEEKLEYNVTVHQPFIDFKEDYDSLRGNMAEPVTFDTRRKEFYNIPI
jgi:hypothetical protein